MENQNSNLKVVKENAIVSEVKDVAAMAFIEGLLPQLKPFIEPAMEKLESYFGDNEKVFMIRRSPGRKPIVIILDNTKGEYLISNNVETGERKFKASEDAVINSFDTGEFIAKLLSGEFSK